MIADIASSSWDEAIAAPERRIKTAPLPKPLPEPKEQPIPQVWENLTPQKTFRKPLFNITLKGTAAFLSVLMAMMLTATCVWVLSWSW
jgi:hypothetical protein